MAFQVVFVIAESYAQSQFQCDHCFWCRKPTTMPMSRFRQFSPMVTSPVGSYCTFMRLEIVSCSSILEPFTRWIVVKSSGRRRILRWWVFCLWASASNEGNLVKCSRPLCFFRPRTGSGLGWTPLSNLLGETHVVSATKNQSHYCALKPTSVR